MLSENDFRSAVFKSFDRIDKEIRIFGSDVRDIKSALFRLEQLSSSTSSATASSAPFQAPVPFFSGSPAEPSAAASSAARLQPAKPERYNGSKSGFQPWVSNTTAILQFSGIDHNSTYPISYAATDLTGNARRIWDRQCTIKGDRFAGYTTWQQFCDGMRAFIEDPDPAESARIKLRALRQTGSVARYTEAYLGLIADLPDRSAADVYADYINGLKPDVKAWVQQTLHRDRDHTLEAARVAAHQADNSLYRRLAPPAPLARLPPRPPPWTSTQSWLTLSPPL